MNSTGQPPRFFLKLFKRFCKPNLHPYLEGDLLEHFEEKAQTAGLKKARWRFAKDVIKLFRPGIIRSIIPQQKLNHTGMFKHNLIITFRSFRRDFNSFIINLLGLATALTATLFIYLWINDEAQVNRFHTKADRLYQVFLNEPTPNGIETDPGTQVQLAGTLATEFPEVELAASVIPYEWFDGEKFVLSDGNDRFFSSRNQFATKDYFDLFSFELIQGNSRELLTDRRSVVISAELADKLYGTTDALGETLQWLHEDYGGLYQVSGVFETLPLNSTQQFDAVFPFDIIKEDEGEEWLEWTESDPSTFVILKSETSYNAFNQKLKALIKTKHSGLQSTLFAQPFTDTYLYDRYENGAPVGGRIAYLRLFGIIGLSILLIACINFMIVSTAKASTRTKAIGVKKTMGAHRSHLALQYLIESTSVTVIAMLISLSTVWLLLPQFNQLSGKAISLEFSTGSVLILLAIALITGLLAGSYPALYLSGFSPVKALKAQVTRSLNGQLTRRALVIFQFAVSTILIVTVIVVSRQINLIQSKDLGFEKENLIWFTMGKLDATSENNADGLTTERIEAFLQLIKNVPGVQHSSNFAHNVLGAYGTTTGLNWTGKAPETNVQFAQIAGGYELIEAMGMNMAVGRSYSRDFATDLKKIILNETAIKTIGYQDPLGKTINLWGQDREIIGVVKDFHIDMLYEDIKPAFISLSTNDFASQVIVKLSPGNQVETIDRIEQVYKDFFITGQTFEFQTLNDNYREFYAQEYRVGTFTKYATSIALFISCLGLFGFATFTIRRRFKEIAIRKVLGSSPWQVLLLLFGSFARLIGIALVIALPLSAFISGNWLASFAYRIRLEPWYFILAGASVILITLATVGYQVLRATQASTTEHLSLDQ